MRFRLRIGALTDVGKARMLNADSFAVEPQAGLFIVADGVEGQHAGEVASQMATQIIARHVRAPQTKDNITVILVHREKERRRLAEVQRACRSFLAGLRSVVAGVR